MFQTMTVIDNARTEPEKVRQAALDMTSPEAAPNVYYPQSGKICRVRPAPVSGSRKLSNNLNSLASGPDFAS